MEYMATVPDKEFDLAITDPPYFSGPNKSGYYGKGYSSLGVQRAKHYDDVKNWDIPKREYFEELKRVSKNQIIWGANHFSDVFNPTSSCWIVWDKDNGKSSFADAELAYTSFSSAVRIFKYMWNGMHQGSFGGDVRKNTPRIHPTQKPVPLYDWLLKNYSQPNQKILDTHLGSGSSAIAAHYFGCDFVGCEIDADYFNAATERFSRETKQVAMF
ncbi:MAG: site-specific DNA-methyltransferase [Gammaproteobacteria bacterium]|nr:site-specific DNA-methyltransferase [Gammaproteobacteria bacterium]